MNREACYAALLARLSVALPNYWATRDFVSAAQCNRWPALLVHAIEETAIQSDNGNAGIIWLLQANVLLYVEREGSGQPFETTLHALIDAVVAALKAQGGEMTFGDAPWTTLGGLVERAWVQGTVELWREPDDRKAIVVIPVEMRAIQ